MLNKIKTLLISGNVLTAIFLIISTSQVSSQYWSALGNGIYGSSSNSVYALSRDMGVIAGGGWGNIGGDTSFHGTALWSYWYQNLWSPMGRGVGGTVNSFAVYHNNLIAGGHFYTDGWGWGGEHLSNIAQWNLNGETWSRLDSGVAQDGTIYALAVFDGKLIAGGDFSNVRGDTEIQNLAQWNGSYWQSMGYVRFNGSVEALTVYKGHLIAGGGFSSIGGVTANYIAQWTGYTWQPLGIGMNNEVRALECKKYNYASDSTYLIAGGLFSNAGGVSASHIAQWNGSSWAPLGGGVDGTVLALSIYNTQLIAGGGFQHAGGTGINHLANHIAQWNGSSWAPLGSGTDGWVYSLSYGYFDDFLTVGGSFLTAGGDTTNHIAIWKDTTGYRRLFCAKPELHRPLPSHQYTRDSIIVLPHDITSFYIYGVGVAIDTLTYPIDSDLEFYLIHQSVTDTMVYQVGGNGANFTGTLLEDNAQEFITDGIAPFTGSFMPNKPFSQFINLDPSGLWILKVYNGGINTGILEGWSLNILYGISPIGIKPISNVTPKELKLSQNYPNPFNPTTNIKFELPNKSFVKLIVYDMLGREVTTLVNEELKAGTYNADWNAINFASGVYFYKLTAGNNVETKKMILIK